MVADRGWRMLVGLFVSVLVTRYLGPERFGLLSYAFSLFAIASAVAGFGIDDVLARELVRKPAEARRLLRNGIFIKLTGALVAFLGVVLMAWWQAADDLQGPLVVGLVGLGLFFQPADVVELWFQSRERMRPPVIARQITLVLAAAIRVGLVASAAPLWCFAAATAFEMALVAVAFTFLWWKERTKPPATGRTPRWRSDALGLVREGWPSCYRDCWS
ncbi:MAG: oligosaccharide flippase family protein [Candidatus Synoicihabitans palmerolidicus]|nr:oligosaccharide flippase family protein [Candidatus Synoicihabitans palmerolidicus]